MDKVQRHQEICNYLSNLYETKNKDYGDSFAKSFDEYVSSQINIWDARRQPYLDYTKFNSLRLGLRLPILHPVPFKGI